MTLCAFGANTGQKRLNMVAILKFKMAAEDNLEKNGSNSDFVLKGIWKVKSIGSTSIANFALDYITPCTIRPGPHQVNFFGLDKAAHRWARISRIFNGPFEATLFGQL